MEPLIQRMSPLLGIILILIVVIYLFTLPGCGDKVEILSDPPGAHIIIDGKSFGRTPTEVNLSPLKNHQVILELDGYNEYEIILTSQSGKLTPSSVAARLIREGY